MIEKSKETSRQAGVVTFLDVLGWKGVYDRQANAITSLKGLVDGVIKQAVEKRGRLSGVDSDVKIKSISDTIAIFTFCNDTEITKAIEIHGELCQWLIPESIKVELPMRGATSCGEFEISDNIFVGKAVDEAASWHEQGNWIGVNLSPSAQFAFSPVGNSSSWTQYSAPLKVQMKWQPYCVNWMANWILPETRRKLICSSFQRMGPIVPEIAPKFINTLAFIDEMLKKMPFGNPKIVVVVEGPTDAAVVNVITRRLGIKRAVVVIVANGMPTLLEKLKEYERAFKDAVGVIILADADTTNEGEIETKKSHFQQIIANSGRSNIHVIFAVPQIEAWLGQTEFGRDRIHNFKKHEGLQRFPEEMESRAQSIPSLAGFIKALKDLDVQP
ncbi:MAG: hypothetical protein AAB263_06000 [Planctomycetota bacterium]